MNPTAALPSPRPRHFAASTLRAMWFVIVPSLLTALVLRYLIPSKVRAPEGILRTFSEWAEPRQSLLALGFFLLFAALLRYWRALLPGAALWADASPAASEPQSWNSTLGWLSLVFLAGFSALVIRSSFIQSYRVLSGSMLPTLQPGEVVLAKQYAYGFHWPWSAPKAPRTPHRGDVVVFRRPPIRPDVPEELVKRVVGLPGDTIKTVSGFFSINGWQVPTCYVGQYVFIQGESMLDAQLRMEYLDDAAYLTARVPSLPSPTEPYTVKPGEVFVLGDNRNNSSDSRAWNDGHGGGLGFQEILGKVERFAVGMHRDGSSDPSLFLKSLEPDVRAEGIDLQEIKEGIDRCLKQRPKQTHPPESGAVQP